MASDNIQVAIRVRQLIQKELTGGLKSHWTVNNNTISCDETDANGRKPTPYVFDRVFDDTTVTYDIFEEICKPIVDSALAGFNGTIFAYGQSSSGKTFTMSGSRVQQGIIALAVDEIFTHIENIPDREFLIRVGYLEIYNEKVSDLLSAEETHLKLQEDTAHNIQVIGLTEEMVQDIQGVSRVLKKGDAKRHTAETKQNDRSSRSHSILRFVIESRQTGHEDDAVNVSNLYFVDLAGSEKANDNSGDRFREGCAINKSLFTLGMVIRKLSGDASQQHVSFRDSKLTRILQNALGGNSKTAIICTITPAHVEDSDSTLKFASRAKNIMNKAVKNEVMSEAAMLKQYRLKIKELERQIKHGVSNSNINVEKAELEKQLEAKKQAEKQQADLISKLQAMIVTSGSGHVTQEPPKKKRRETWCPGKAKREFQVLKPISEISPPKFQDFTMSKGMDNMVLEEEDSFQLLENISIPGSNFANKESPDPNDTIQTNTHLKELFKLQDEHETVLEELRVLNELREFEENEKEINAEEIKQLGETVEKLTNENNNIKESVKWLEEELMKSQNERKNLRHTMEAANAQLNAAQDGSGITEKSQQLTVSEARVSNLNNDLEIQKSQYEFAIQQLKHKLEVYTTMLEENGVDYNTIKGRLTSQSEELEQIHTQKNDAIEELKHKHEQEISDLRNEVDMLVISLEKEKTQTAELQKQFDLEFEDQKTRFQKDVAEAKEEIEIYQQMLEEEKLKSSESEEKSEETTVSVDDAKLTELQTEFESQKQTYEAEIERLQNVVKALSEAQENIKVESDEEKTKTEKETEKLKADYDSQIQELSKKLEVEVNSKTVLESEHEKEISDLKKINEDLETEFKEHAKEKIVESKECQTEKVERHVNFDIYAEMDSQKERYEDMIKELTEERDAYHAVLEEKSINESQASNVELVKSQYEEQITALKYQLDKFQEAHSEKSNSYSDVDDEIPVTEEIKEDQAVQFKQQILELESEVEKYKDLLESEKAKVRKSEGFSFTFDESVCERDSRESSIQMNMNGGMDLEKEMLQAEINKLRETHECEVNELREEIAKYASLVENNQSKSIVEEGSSRSPDHKVDIEVNEQLHDEMDELRNKVQQLTNDLNAEKAKNNKEVDVEVLDLRSEMLKAESENSESIHLEKIRDLESKLASYEELSQQPKENSSEENEIEAKNLEIVELKTKLTSYEDMLQQERVKLERILESVDERRSQIENHDSMKSVYEEKIKELNEEIKIYMDLMEEGRSQNTEKQQCEMESNDMDMSAYREESERLKTELEKFTNLYEMEKEKNSRENTAEQNDLNLSGDEKLRINIAEIQEKHKNEIEFMKEEFAKFAEQHLDSKQESDNDIEEIKSLYEKEIENLKTELADFKKSYEQLEGAKSDTECFDLKSELLKSEFDTLKESHKAEIESLQIELEKIKSAQKDSEDLSQTEEIKVKYEKEISELREKLEAISASSLQSSVKESVNEDRDVQSELLRAEIETLKAKHREEMKNFEELLEPDNCKKTVDVSLNTSKIVQVESDTPETDEVKQLRLDVEKYQTSLEEEREKCSHLEQSIHTSKKEHEVYEKTIVEMQEDLSTMTSQLQQLPRDIEVLQAAVTRLKQEKLDLLNARERLSQLSDKHEDSIQELQDEIKELQDNIGLLENENDGLKANIQKLEQHITIGKGMLASKDEEIGRLSNDIENLRDDANAEVQEKVQDMTEYVTELETKVNDTEEALKQANEKVEELEQCEAQFSDKIISLESDVEIYKEKEDTLSKVCTEYEEKIVTLESDLEAMKLKNVELESSCTDMEKKIEGLSEHLELAQNKDMELKEIQCRYQDKITELETEIKQLTNNVNEIESDRNEQRNKYENVLSEVEGLEKELKKEIESKDKIEQERGEIVRNLEQQLEKSKEKVQESEEKMVLYVETLKELEDEINLKEEENKQLDAKISELEVSGNVAMETQTENDRLKVKLETLESNFKEKLDLIYRYEAELVSAKEKLSEVENSRKGEEELESVKAELNAKVENAQEKVNTIEAERNEAKHMAESLKTEKETIEKRLEELEKQKLSLEEDNLQLEKGLHPMSLKYHSKPENVDWENKWTDYCREEKIKRIAVYGTVKSLRKDLKKAEERQKNAYEEALQTVYEKEQNTDVYKKMEEHLKTVNDEANTLYYDLEAERKITKELKDKIETLGKDGAQKSDINFMTEDHPCKYKLEGFSAIQKLQTAVEEHNKRVSQYEETIQHYEGRIARMKNEMRRLQTDFDTTFDERSLKQPKFEKDEVKAQPSPAPPAPDNMSLGSSMRSGVIDHFRVCEMSAENKRLQQEIEKQKKKLSRVQNIEQENAKVKEELQSFRKKYRRVEEIEKENNHLKEELKKVTDKGKDLSRDTSLLGSSTSRNPLGDMFFTGSESVTESMPIPPSPKKEPRFKVPDLNPTKKEDTLIEHCKEEVNNCKTS